MNRWVIYILTLGTFLTATSELIVAGILKSIADDMHISIALAGQLITAYSLAFAVGTPIVIALTSRMRRKKLLAGSLAVFIIGCLASFASPSYSVLMLSRMILGVTSGVYLVVAFSSAVKLVPSEKIGSAIGTIILGFSSAMVLGVPAGIAITSLSRWQVIFILLAIATLFIMLAVIRLLPEIEGDAPVPFKQQFGVLGNIVIVSGLLVTLFREGGNSILYTYLTPYLQNILHMDASGVGMLMLGLGVCGIAASRLGGYAVDKWGTSRMISYGIAVQVAALALVPLFKDSLTVGLLLIIVSFGSVFVTAPAVQAYFIQLAPRSSNLVLSLNTSVTHLGLAAGAGAGGLLVNTTSTVLYNPWMAGFAAALSLITAVVSFSMRKKTVLNTNAEGITSISGELNR